MALVGVVTTSYPRHAGDFAGSFVRERVRALVAAGATVEVVAAGVAVSERLDPGVTVTRVPAAGGLFSGPGAPEVLEESGLRGLIAAAGFTAGLCAVVAARRWDAVESHWLAPCGLAAAATTSCPHRAFAHGGDVALLERLPGGAALARTLVGATLFFASDDLRCRFERLCGFAVRSTVQPAPFDRTLFFPRGPDERARLRREYGWAGPVVLGVGRLVPVKGWELLVRAVARLPRSRRPAVVLAGAGPERDALAARAAGRVELRLLGLLDRAAVADLMAAADLYVQPSRSLANGRGEGTPLALREALAAGLRAVATRTGGVAEMIHPRLALVTPARLDELSQAVDAGLYSRGSAQESTHLEGSRCERDEAHTPLQCG